MGTAFRRLRFSKTVMEAYISRRIIYLRDSAKSVDYKAHALRELRAIVAFFDLEV